MKKTLPIALLALAFSSTALYAQESTTPTTTQQTMNENVQATKEQAAHDRQAYKEKMKAQQHENAKKTSEMKQEWKNKNHEAKEKINAEKKAAKQHRAEQKQQYKNKLHQQEQGTVNKVSE